jgi:phosphoenolpyruvate synthase/pyruvate phosphate dikinase
VVTAAAYLAAVSESGGLARSPGCWAGSMSTTPHRLQRHSGAAHEEIKATPIPAEIADAIENAYRSPGNDVAVAVRSSGTTRMPVTAR